MNESDHANATRQNSKSGLKQYLISDNDLSRIKSRGNQEIDKLKAFVQNEKVSMNSEKFNIYDTKKSSQINFGTFLTIPEENICNSAQ